MSQPTTTQTPTIIRDLGNGLVLRQATMADIAPLTTFAIEIFGGTAAFIRHFMEGKSPICDASQFTLIEDTNTNAIVSSLCLIAQTWSYEGIRFGVGQPEFVLTRPEYRRRGLIRAQMEVVHEWSAKHGDLVQAITGIPYFYRQFGYEMGLDLGGSQTGFPAYVPKLKESEIEPYQVRQATEADIPFIGEIYDYSVQRYLVNTRYNEADWRDTLLGWSADEPKRDLLRIIEAVDGETVGFLVQSSYLLNAQQMPAWVYELKPSISWLAVTPTVIRYLCATGEEYAKRDQQVFGSFGFHLGPEHPAYAVASTLLSRQLKPYAYYVRVPDLPRFIQHIAPALEQRLAASIAVGHTGELRLSFYNNGLRLVFNGGKLVIVEPWMPMPRPGDGGMASFPDLTFLQLLFGYRTLAELRYAFADCRAESDEANALLDILFPKRVSRGNTWTFED